MNARSDPRCAENPIDAHVRLRLRMRRRVLGITEAGLAEAIGVSLAALRAIERGATPLTPVLLWRMTQALRCSPNDLFAGLCDPPGSEEG
jgi:transcriptional regulator with XRE-family HTH domain